MRTSDILRLLQATAEHRLKQVMSSDLGTSLRQTVSIGDRSYSITLGIHDNLEVVVEKCGQRTHLAHSQQRDLWYIQVDGSWEPIHHGSRELDIRLLQYVVDLQIVDDAESSRSHQVDYLI